MERSNESRDSILEDIKSQAAAERVRVTQHAAERMARERIDLDEILEAIRNAELLEHYPEHRRGPCCLLHGRTNLGRHLHIVCTTTQPVLVLITVYEPKLAKWITSKLRRGKT